MTGAGTIRIAAPLTAVALLLVAGGCANGGGRVSGQQRSPPIEVGATREHRLGSADVLTVNVWRNPDLSVEVAVRPDGHISVPLVGDVLASGRTPAEISADVEQKLQRFLRAPRVSIVVAELDSAGFGSRVRVVGGVAEPKSIAYRDGMTVVDLVLEAGGLGELATPDGARLHRTVEGKTRTYPIYLDSILRGGAVDTNYTLLPGDVISIPERRF